MKQDSAPDQGKRRGGKRGNGEGTIYERAPGQWRAALTLENGKRKVLCGRTRQEVAKKLTAALQAREQGLPVAGARQSITALLDSWLEAKKPSLQPLTHESYKEVAELHLKPTIGKINLSKLTPQSVDSLLAQKLQSGLSARRVQYIRAVLRMALNHAMKRGLVGRNVAQLSISPKVTPPAVRPKSIDDALALLKAVEGDRLETLYTLVAMTGLRQGEALALRWSDLDLIGGTLTVSGTLQKIGGVFERREHSKTKHSRRVLCLSAELISDLHAHRSRQLQERLLAGAEWQDWGLVFTRQDGRPLEGTWVTKHLQLLLTKAGLDRQRFHDLRHDAASLMHANGDDLRTIMANLGHSTIATTANIYTHVTQETQRRSAQRMGALLARRQ